MRIPTQAENERNFHIFYQMCKGGDDEERERWELQGAECLDEAESTPPHARAPSGRGGAAV